MLCGVVRCDAMEGKVSSFSIKSDKGLLLFGLIPLWFASCIVSDFVLFCVGSGAGSQYNGDEDIPLRLDLVLLTAKKFQGYLPYN